MPNMHCNIIKDLLPSYADDICSLESRQLVEEHLAECENCKKIYELTKEDMKKTTSSDVKEVDYFKKIKHNVFKKNAVINVIIALLFALQIYCVHNSYRWGSDIPRYINYFFPILIAGILFVIMPDYAERAVPTKLKYTALGIEFGAMTYVFLLMLYVFHSVLNGHIPFGLEGADLGPFIANQIFVANIGFMAAFVITLILFVRKKRICPAMLFLPLGGLSLMFEYQNYLHELDTVLVLQPIIIPYFVFLGEVIVLVALYMFLNKKKL